MPTHDNDYLTPAVMTAPGICGPLFDRLADLTRDPDAAFSELAAMYTADDRLRVPATVYNAILNRSEPVLADARGPLPSSSKNS
jgi:hypothetical protein